MFVINSLEVAMLGAIVGDIVGSRFEFNNHRSKDFELFTKDCFFTDDTIMTLAVAKCVAAGYEKGNYKIVDETIVPTMQRLGKKYPNAGWGGMFNLWLGMKNPYPYDSFGNGAAMRVSSCGFFAKNIPEAAYLSDKVTRVSHNHPEGMKGARVVAEIISMILNGASRTAVRDYAAQNYNINFTCDSIRSTYQFNETCQETVPQAIVAFLESKSFEDAIRNAISVGGDSDTLAAITGSIAEAYYGVPKDIEATARTYLDKDLLGILDYVYGVYDTKVSEE